MIAMVSFKSKIRGSSSCLRLKASSWRVTDPARSAARRISSTSVRAGCSASTSPSASSRVAGDGGQRVVEVVRDAAREPADRLHLLRLPELILELAAVGDVLHRADHLRGPALGVPEDVRLLVHPADGAIGTDDAMLDIVRGGRGPRPRGSPT